MKLNYVYKKYDDYYVGHLIEYPEYETQGKTIAELEIMLMSLYKDLINFKLSKHFQRGVFEFA